MSFFEVLIFGLVEGITEFLPISSTAHLDFTRIILGLNLTNFLKSFQIAIQLGAILAVVYLYKDKLIHQKKYLSQIITAFIPTGIIGFVLYKIVKNYFFGNSFIMIISLFLGGILILFFEKYYKKEGEKKDILSFSKKDLILLGIFQSLAIIPGISRSLSVIFGGKILNIEKKTITEFSFLLAIPTMLSATVYDLYKNGFAFEKGEWLDLSLGFMISFFVALFVVRWLLDYISKNSFAVFGWYRIFLAVILAFFLI